MGVNGQQEIPDGEHRHGTSFRRVFFKQRVTCFQPLDQLGIFRHHNALTLEGVLPNLGACFLTDSAT